MEKITVYGYALGAVSSSDNGREVVGYVLNVIGVYRDELELATVADFYVVTGNRSRQVYLSLFGHQIFLGGIWRLPNEKEDEGLIRSLDALANALDQRFPRSRAGAFGEETWGFQLPDGVRLVWCRNQV
jgi:hypothetical protein